jgi:cytochrome c553
MNYDLTKMQENLRAEFETILQFVTGTEAQTATADHIERSLFQLLLSLGAQLLLLFFQMRSQTCSRRAIIIEGQKIPYNSEQGRVYFSVFGKVPLFRPYFYTTEAGGHTPLDAELSLGADRYSDMVREIMAYLGVYVPYNKAVDIFRRILKSGVSTRVEQKLVDEDSQDVLAYYEQKAAPEASDEAEILVVQADGKGVPIILEKSSSEPVRLGKGQKRGRKKEAVVTTVYTIAANPRTPEDVVDSFFGQNGGHKKAQSSPQNKHIWATLDGKERALTRLAQQTEPRYGSHIQHKVALSDGCEALQERLKETFPDFTLVLDFVHANEYLWKVANSLLGEGNDQRTQWVMEQTKLMLSGQTEQIIADFRAQAQARKTTKVQAEKLNKTANYFERNLKYMDYNTCLAKGWPIASGVIEGACRHFVKDRFELSGMRWEQSGAENLLRLRAVAENGDWDDYHLFRLRQRHRRLYNSPFPTQNPLEIQALKPLSSTTPQPVEPTMTGNISPAHQPVVEQKSNIAENPAPSTSSDYYALPLAA